MRQARTWQQRNSGAGPLRVNVNLSPVQLRQTDAAAQISHRLAGGVAAPREAEPRQAEPREAI